jgi:pyruvate,orthophosphate dikinase
MQARAIFEAACDAAEQGVRVEPEVMIPLVGARKELDNQAAVVRRTADEVFRERRRKVKYLVGTMIEVPRGALTAGDIAGTAEFFSFGTNDLTQTAFGFSRDDIGKFVSVYEERKLVPANPFVTIDVPGAGRLMRIAVADGKAANPSLHLGICGEHGGDPASVAFCEELGLDYVSCSPFRIETARLAAGQAAIGDAESASK